MFQEIADSGHYLRQATLHQSEVIGTIFILFSLSPQLAPILGVLMLTVSISIALICALIPLLMSRFGIIFLDKIFSYEVRKRLLEFMLSAFQHSPNFIALLKKAIGHMNLLHKPIMDRLGEAYDSPDKTKLALQLCWAIGKHGGGGESHKDEAHKLFESLELLLRLGLTQEVSFSSDMDTYRRSSQSRLLCFVVTTITKLATHHRELLPRARISLGKVAQSLISYARVWRRACDFLGSMNDPATLSVPKRSSSASRVINLSIIKH